MKKVENNELKMKSSVTYPNALDLSEQRQIAKAGMVGSLGGLFVTGFVKSKGARMSHPWLGWVFLGFSIWHHMVSKPPTK